MQNLPYDGGFGNKYMKILFKSLKNFNQIYIENLQYNWKQMF